VSAINIEVMKRSRNINNENIINNNGERNIMVMKCVLMAMAMKNEANV
jgi:hypothetical protein